VKYVLDGRSDPVCEWETLWIRSGTHCKVQGLFVVSCAKTAESIEMQFGLLSQVSSWNHILDGGADAPSERGTFMLHLREVHYTAHI